MAKAELSVGEVARRSGVAVSTLHFYEAEGLIRCERSRAGHRRYGRDVLRRIAVIRIAQQAGLPLKDIADSLSALPNGRTPNARDWEKMSAGWRDLLDRRIAMLSGLRDNLSGCIGCGCLSLELCPLRNADDNLGAFGSGAQLIPQG